MTEKLPKVTHDDAYGGTKAVLKGALLDHGLPFEYGLSGLLNHLDRWQTQLRDEQADQINQLRNTIDRLKALI